MLRSSLAVGVVALAGLFGYFYFTDASGKSTTDKAKDAVMKVGDTVRDKGVASLVEGRLLAQFGYDATRFISTYYDEGTVIIYGMAPASIDPAALEAEAAKVTGVKNVILQVMTRPEMIQPVQGLGGEKTPAAEPAGESEATP